MADEAHDNLDDDRNKRFPRALGRSPRITGAAAKQHYGDLGETPAPCGATVGSFTLHRPAVTCGVCKKALGKSS